MTIYDECLQELLTWYSAGEPGDLHGMDLVVAERIMRAAARGCVDSREIRCLALNGLLPGKAVGSRQ